jgi:hypothetical protein
MKEYVVQSGSLKITIVADCPREAALEAVACWQGQPEQQAPSRPGGLQPELMVRRRGHRLMRHFSAVRMLSQLRGQSVSMTWKQLLQQAIASPN